MPKIIPQPATSTPGQFQKQIVQLDPYNIDNEEAAEKPHSSLLFRGGDILADLESALSVLTPSPKLIGSGPRFFLPLPVAESAVILGKIGFKQENAGSNLFFRQVKK